MSTEIELKYLIGDGEVINKFTQLLKQQNLPYTHQSQQLCNTYFDTQDRQLRALDFGLRVRKADNYTEQTIKTAGIIVGGLHQRPEYNVEIDDSFPELSLFPADIWPEYTNANALQAQLVSIFSTNFIRNSWQVEIDGSVIEVAYDRGMIESQGQELPISEIELELVEGKRDAIFTLAQLLIEHFEVTSGRESKAARGYQLWQGTTNKSDDNGISFQVSLTAELSVEKAMVVGLEHGLHCLQQAIAASLDSPKLGNVKQVFEALSFIQQGFYLHQNLIEESKFELFDQLLKQALDNFSWLESAIHINDLTVKSGSYRKKLEYSKQLITTLKIERSRFPNEQEIKQCLTGQAINLLQLKLLTFILSPVVKPVEKTRSLLEHAQVKLSKNLNAITELCANKSQLTVLEYLVIQHHLFQGLHTGSWFGALYDNAGRVEYRRTWLDVLHGIEELATLNVLQQQLKALEQHSENSKKLNKWLSNKVENLLAAINQSYQSALTVEPYWQ